MALPTLDKTWQFTRTGGASTTNKRLISTGVPLTDQRQALLQIINDMISFPLSPWTVVGSANGAGSFGMDGVNRWDGLTKLVFATNTGTAHSWIVLQQSGISTKFQICFDLVNASNLSNADGRYMDLYVSGAAGFGTANGGTDGTNTTRPTATDENPYGTTGNANFIDGGSNVTAHTQETIISTMQSSDGQAFRCLIRLPGSRYSVYFNCEKPKNPISGWTNPYFGRWTCIVSSSGDQPTYANFNDTSNMRTRVTALGTPTNTGLYVGTEGFSGAMAGQWIVSRNELLDQWELYPTNLYCTSPSGARGRYGKPFDMWWCSTSLSSGETFPSDGSRQFLVVGDIVIPWDGSIPVLA